MQQSFWLPLAGKDDVKTLRQFGRGFGILLAIVFGALLPWLAGNALPQWPWITGAVLVIMAQLYPCALYPVYWLWMHVASVLNFINTRIIMLIAFYLLLLPIGLVMRLRGKLQYQTSRKSNRTYWLSREDSPGKDNLKDPF